MDLQSLIFGTDPLVLIVTLALFVFMLKNGPAAADRRRNHGTYRGRA